MNTYLITPTLIQSWQYWYNYDGDKEEEVKSSFLATLKREKTPTNEAMQAGINFEKQVIQCSYDKPWTCNEVMACSGNNCILDIAQIIENGMFQVALKKEIKVADTNFLLYGKADVIKQDTIFDIKYTTNADNYNIGKYSNSVQHLLYMFCAELNKFQYIISDGDTYWLEDYNVSNIQIHTALLDKIYNFYSFIQNNQELLTIFQDKWIAQ